MSEDRWQTDKEFIPQLCMAIEKRVGRTMTSPRDFQWLSAELAKGGTRISESTLKRLWGYNQDISDTYRPYKYTLIALVNMLGFRDIDDYLENYDSNDVQSAQYVGETISADNIMPGNIVELSWSPNRVCNLLCMEKGVFKVVHAERGHLHTGDIVRLQSLTQNAPLYFNEVYRPSTNERFLYTAGQRTGIRFLIQGLTDSPDTSISY